MVALQVTFLTGSIAARREDDDRAVEWPPHPARLFAALAAAFFEGNEDSTERVALEWLEAQGPPEIWAAGSAGTPRRLEAFVPANDRDVLKSITDPLGLGRLRQPRTFTSASLSDPDVIYGWPDLPDDAILAALDRLGSRVACLGHSASLVRIVRTSTPDTEPTWRPADRGTTVLRGTFPGMLDALRHADARYLRAGIRGRLPSVPFPYVRSRPPLKPAAPRRAGHFDTLWSLRKTAGPALPILASAGMAGALHRALLARWGDLAGRGLVPPIPEEISGHTPDGAPTRRPHLAIVGLPAVGHPRSDGHLLGLGLVLPTDLPDETRRALRQVVEELRVLALRPGDWSLELVEQAASDHLPAALQARTWRRETRIWASATPVVLDRYPRNLYGDEAEQIVRAACERAGLPEPASVILGPTSPLTGVPPARDFPGYPGGASAPRVHATLAFSVPIAGPILIGRGRFRGLGLFRPLGG